MAKTEAGIELILHMLGGPEGSMDVCHSLFPALNVPFCLLTSVFRTESETAQRGAASVGLNVLKQAESVNKHSLLSESLFRLIVWCEKYFSYVSTHTLYWFVILAQKGELGFDFKERWLLCKSGQLGLGEGSVSSCNLADDKFSSQKTSQSASQGCVMSSTQRTTVKTQNRHTDVEQICMQRSGSSVSPGSASCVPVCSLHVLCALNMSFLVMSSTFVPLIQKFLQSLLLSEEKIHRNESCECVWKSNMRVCFQGPPSQTQQGAGGGEKHRPGSLTPFLRLRLASAENVSAFLNVLKKELVYWNILWVFLKEYAVVFVFFVVFIILCSFLCPLP